MDHVYVNKPLPFAFIHPYQGHLDFGQGIYPKIILIQEELDMHYMIKTQASQYFEVTLFF